MYKNEPAPNLLPGKKRKDKCGRENSEYSLKVVFLPAFAHPRKMWWYNSDPPFGNMTAKDQLDKLIDRVLKGSCAGRYQSAELIHNPSGKTIKRWDVLPDETAGKDATSKDAQAIPYSLNIYVICKDSYVEKIAKKGIKHPLTIPSSDVCKETGIAGEDAALVNFRRLLSTEPLRFNVKMAFVYWTDGNKRVARYDHQARLTFLDTGFRDLILSKGNFSAHKIGYFGEH